MRFRLANGRGAELDAGEPLSREPYLVAVDMVGKAGALRILCAAELSKTDILNHFETEIRMVEDTGFDPVSGKFETMRSTRLGNLVLDKPVPVAIDGKAMETALLGAVKQYGLDLLQWQDRDLLLRGRLQLLHQTLGDPWPSLDEDQLLGRLEEWLFPFLNGVSSLHELKAGSISDGLLLLAGHPAAKILDELVPTHFKAPSGSLVPFDYQTAEDGECRVILQIRPQQLFGLDVHPSIIRGAVSIDIELVSPAGRAIQITRDLPGFWRGSWRDVRAEMRGRYPKHPWPEEPLFAAPTRRANPRKK